MNIVRLTTRIYPDKAGPAVYAYFLSKHVSDKRFRMFNVTCRPIGFKDKYKTVNENFNIYYLPLRASKWNAKAISQILFLIRFGYYSLKKLLQLHRKYRIDLIHCDNPAVTGLIAVIFNRIFRIPCVYTQHGLDSHFKLNFLLELKLIYQRAASYIIVSRRMIPFFEKNKLDTKKLKWIPVGVELNRFFHVSSIKEKEKIINDLEISSFIDNDDFIIIYVGFMDLKQKVYGMIDFLHSFKIFLSELSENQKKKIKLLYLGDGKYRKKLKKELKILGLNENVFLLGTRLEIEKFYAISDFLALTSYVEGFPTVLLEAIASNVPCICTDVGEVDEILDENSIIPCGEREEIVKKLRILYKDKNLCDTILKNSLKKVRQFDWSNIAEKVKRLYKETILTTKTK